MKKLNLATKSILLGTMTISSIAIFSNTIFMVEENISTSLSETEITYDSTPENGDSFVLPIGFNAGNDYISFSVAMKTTAGDLGRDVKYVLDNPDNKINVSIEQLTDDRIPTAIPTVIYEKTFDTPTGYIKSYENDGLTDEQSYFVPVYDFMITNDDLMGISIDNEDTYDNPLTSEDDLLLVVDSELPFEATYGGQAIENGTVFSAGVDPLFDEAYYNNDLEDSPNNGFLAGERYKLVLDFETYGAEVQSEEIEFSVMGEKNGLEINQQRTAMESEISGYNFETMLTNALVRVNYDGTSIGYESGDSITISSGATDLDQITSDVTFSSSEITATRNAASIYDEQEVYGTFNPRDGYKSTSIEGVEANFINTKSNDDYEVVSRDRYRAATNIVTPYKLIEFTNPSGFTIFKDKEVSTGDIADFVENRQLNWTMNATTTGTSGAYTMRLPSLYSDDELDLVGVGIGGTVDANGNIYTHEKGDSYYQTYFGATIQFYAPLKGTPWYDTTFNEYWQNVFDFTGSGGVSRYAEVSFKQSDNGTVVSGGESYQTSDFTFSGNDGDHTILDKQGYKYYGPGYDQDFIDNNADKKTRNAPVVGIHLHKGGKWMNQYSFISEIETFGNFASIDKTTLPNYEERFSIASKEDYNGNTNQVAFNTANNRSPLIRFADATNNGDGTFNIDFSIDRYQSKFYDKVYGNVLYEDESSTEYGTKFGEDKNGTGLFRIDPFDTDSTGKINNTRGKAIEAVWDESRREIKEVPNPHSKYGSPVQQVTDWYTLKNLPIGEDILIGTFSNSSKYTNINHKRDNLKVVNYSDYDINNGLLPEGAQYINKNQYGNLYQFKNNELHKGWYSPLNIYDDITFLDGTQNINDNVKVSVGAKGASLMFTSKYDYKKFNPLLDDNPYNDPASSKSYSRYKKLSSDNLFVEIFPTIDGTTASGPATGAVEVETRLSDEVPIEGKSGWTKIDSQEVHINVSGLEEGVKYLYKITYDSDFDDIIIEGSFNTSNVPLLYLDTYQFIIDEATPSKVTMKVNISSDGSTSFNAMDPSLEAKYGVLEDVTDIWYVDGPDGPGQYTYEIDGLQGSTTYSGVSISLGENKLYDSSLPSFTTAEKLIGDTPIENTVTINVDDSKTSSTSVTVDYSYKFLSDDDLYYYLDHNYTEITELRIYDVSTLSNELDQITLATKQPYDGQNTGGRSGQIIIDGLKSETDYTIQLGVVYNRYGNDIPGVTKGYVSEAGEVRSQKITIRTNSWSWRDINWWVVIITTILIASVIGMIVVAILYYRSHH